MTQKEDKITRQIEEITKEIAEKFVKKKQFERFMCYCEELSKFLSSGFEVVTGTTQEEMLGQLYQIIKHAEGLWNDATLLFKKKRYSTACFLSITCIEECAKINFGEFQFYDSVTNSKNLVKNQQSSTKPRGKNPLRYHTRKHFVAACSGALVNSRMDGILGTAKITSFISDCEKGKLERLRQSCLYTDIDQRGQRVLLPKEQINKEQALFYICLAGELLTEVAGIDYSILEGLRDRVDKFEKENGIGTKK